MRGCDPVPKTARHDLQPVRRGCKLPADTRPRHEMLHFHYVRVLGTHGDHPSTSEAQKYFFFTTYQPNPERLHSARGPSHATLPVSPIRLTDRAERLALVSSTQRTAIEALRSTPAGTRWAVQLRRTIVHISLFAAQLLRDGL